MKPCNNYTTIWCSYVLLTVGREASASRHHGDPIKSPPKSPWKSRNFFIWEIWLFLSLKIRMKADFFLLWKIKALSLRATCRVQTPLPLQKWPIFFCPKRCVMFQNVCKKKFWFFLYYFVLQNFNYKFLGLDNKILRTWFLIFFFRFFCWDFSEPDSETLTSDIRQSVG